MSLGRHRTTLTLLSLTLAILGACNLSGTYVETSGGFFGGSGSTGGEEKLPSTRTGVCEEATAGAKCADADDCELGEDPNPACNDALRCFALHWEVVSKSHPCVHDCPSTLVLEQDGGCDGPNARDLRCEYPDERSTCGCAAVDRADGGADAGSNSSDGGDAGVARYEWKCIAAPEGCPRTRPHVGTACVRPMICDYGRCLFDNGEELGLAVHCFGDTWLPYTQTFCDVGSTGRQP